MTKSVTAQAPATAANAGPGFDVFGFALSDPKVTVTVSYGDAGGQGIAVTNDDSSLPTDPLRNTAGVAVRAMMAERSIVEDVVVHVHGGIPVGSGMGSSAASAVAAAVAANTLFNAHYSELDLMRFAVAGEAASAGVAHADNVAPALCGGMVLVRNTDPLDYVALSFPKDLHYVVVHPNCVVRTADARKVLPKKLPLSAAVQQWANMGSFVAALASNDFDLLGRSLNPDVIVEERSKLIPGYDTVCAAAKRSGAIGCSISGSGPSVLAYSTNQTNAQRIAEAMQKAFAQHRLDSQAWCGPVATQGAQVIA